MKISILDDYQDAVRHLKCFHMLSGYNVEILTKTEKEPYILASKLNESDIVVLIRERTNITEELLQQLPKLKLISQTGKISNHINLDVCNKYGVAVAEGIGSPIAPAELTWALILNSVRKIPQAIAGMQNGDWQTNIGSTIYGKTIGIWGYGKIGQKIAQYAKVFGANVLVWGSERSCNKAIDHGFESALSKSQFFNKSDIVTLHLRLNENTIGIVRETDLMEMKEGSTLIKTARYELFEENALLNVLQSGKKINVGLDVYDSEPIYDIKHELLNMENVNCTPHIGYVEENSYELYFSKAFENVVNYIKGEPSNVANP